MTLTRGQVDQQFPGAADAVWLHEDPEYGRLGDRLFALARRQGMNPRQAVEGLLQGMTIVLHTKGPNDRVDWRHLEQLSHPDFLRYVARRLGFT